MEMQSDFAISPSFAKIPDNVLVHIALDTVSISSDIPTPSDLATLHALLFTSRKFHGALSATRSPDIHAGVFRLMFDINPAKRPLGSLAVVPPASVLELQRRVELLRRIKDAPTRLEDYDDGAANAQSVLDDLSMVSFMLLDNDGKNQRQLHLAGVEQFIDVLFTRSMSSPRSGTTLSQDACFSLVVLLLWMTNPQSAVLKECSERREAILDILQPFILPVHLLSPIRVDSREHRLECHQPSITVEYFGLRFAFTPPPLTPFASLCTVMRYHSTKRISDGLYPLRIISHADPGSTLMPTVPGNSHSFDVDWRRCISSEPQDITSKSCDFSSHLVSGYPRGTFDGIWSGAFFTPYIIKSESNLSPHIDACEKAMRYDLREYHCFSAEEAMCWADDDEEGHGLARAWFPEGVEWSETATCLMLYDPTKSRWLSYQPYSPSTAKDKPSKDTRVVYDTVIVGTSAAAHGSRFGEFTVHGRVRPQDGLVALVRKPAHTPKGGLGTWIFHGQVHGGRDLVGDWRAAATTDYLPGRQGWFTLSKESA